MERKNFGTRIKELRIQAGLSQRSVAERVGISFTYLSKIENGILPPPGEELIFKIAEILSGDKDELLTLAGKVPSDIVSELLNNPDVLKSLRTGRIKKSGTLSYKKEGNFGKRLKELREKAGLSQSELAEKIGVNFTYLSKIENGVKPAPSQKVIKKLADILNTDADELLAIAGKISADIVNKLNDQETLQALRGSLENKKINTARRTRSMEIVKNLFNYKRLSRVALPIMLVIAVAGSLWFGTPTPTKALQMEIVNPPSGTISKTYYFTFTVTIESGELLPIGDIDLSIFKADDEENYTATCENLPIANGGNHFYTNIETGGGTVNVTAVAPDLNQQQGAGYVVWQGYAYRYEEGPGYGPSTITYNIGWTPPTGWPTGSYAIEAEINTTGKTFSQKSSQFTLSALTMLAETSLGEGFSTVREGVVVVRVNIDRIKNASTGATENLTGGLGSYAAQITMPNGGIEVVEVLGIAPYNNVVYNADTKVFSVNSAATPIQPNNTTVAELVLKLTGSCLVSNNLNVAFVNIGAAGDPLVNVPEEEANTLAFLRGNTTEVLNGDFEVDIFDALFIAQQIVGQKTVDQIRALNGASVKYDATELIKGDVLDIFDALFIAQMIVGQKNEYYVAP